ncbi:MAG: beta-ketoacyl-[acyl-carrier-protein] synthase family protein, partial [Thermodesulfobacteriota bacterium]
IHGYREIKAGKAEAYLAGGLDACLTYHMYAALIASGFQVVSSLPAERISRPYDKKREGAICSEGAAFVVLEELRCAERRGAVPYAEILGSGESFERPSQREVAVRRGLARSMRLALDDAGLSPSDVDYVCSHGPSLITVDEMETLAIKDVFGKAAYTVPVSSIKSMIGNPMAASGPMQVIAALMAMNHSVVPPTINLDFPDPGCDLDYVPNKARRNRVEISLVDSHGLDNMDVSIILARCDH